MKLIKAGAIVLVVLFMAAAVSAVEKEGQGLSGSKPTDKNVSGFTNSMGMEFVKIPSGTGKLGKGGWKVPEGFRDVEFAQGFFLQATEVTQRQYTKVMGKDPSLFKYRRDDFPVEQVSKDDALEFIRRLNEMEGTTEYRLPTSDEWEYACRAGSTTVFSTGDCIGANQANINGPESDLYYCPDAPRIRLGRPQPVKSYSPNPWGLYDMHGNLKEWVAEKIVDHSGHSNNAVMGGCYFQDASNATSYYRETQGTFDDYKTTYIGFRVLASRGIQPKPFHGDSEPYMEPRSDMVSAQEKREALKAFFSKADFGQPRYFNNAKPSEFLIALGQDFTTQENIEHIEPLFCADHIRDSRFASYKAINPKVTLDAFEYEGYESVATRDLALFEIEMDGNNKNGKEIVVFGDDFFHPFSRLSIKGTYTIFEREKLKKIGGYGPYWDWIGYPSWPVRDYLHGILAFKGKTLFWSATWYDNSKNFHFNLSTYYYDLRCNRVKYFQDFNWDKKKQDNIRR